MIRLASLLSCCMTLQLMMNRLRKFRIVWSAAPFTANKAVNSLPVAEEKKPESRVHKSLAEILGIPKRGEPVDQPKVAVVIDPKIAKVLRPHQIEGVKAV